MAVRFLRTVRSLAQCFQAFERLSRRHVLELGLTPDQFDIIATLGNTNGMTAKELGEATLITKGTLTGVVGRLAARGLVNRRPNPSDRRGTIIGLTADGEQLFDRTFVPHVEHLATAFVGFDDEELAAIETRLNRLCSAFDAATGPAPSAANGGGRRAIFA